DVGDRRHAFLYHFATTRLSTRRAHAIEHAVRFELNEALARPDISLIPVLVEDALMPAAKRLPTELRSLCDCNAQPMHDRSYDQDLNRLIERLAALAAKPGMGRERLLDLISELARRGVAEAPVERRRDRALSVLLQRGWTEAEVSSYLPRAKDRAARGASEALVV
ncbi:MAG TPA: hypothetical protein VI300_17555, partial [Solirubrobacter sp.]